MTATPQIDQSYKDALEQVLAGKVKRSGGYVELPTVIFVQKVDVNMSPLPPIGFYRMNEQGQPESIRKPDQPYSALVLSSQTSIWVREEDFARMQAYVESVIITPSATGGPSTETRMEALRRSAMVVVEDLFENPSPENINRGVKVVSSFVHVLMKDPKAYQLLTKLSSHDPYTLQHSVGTAVHTIILGRKMGITDEVELNELGLAGLLHDIGKVKVRKEIINKNGPLDETEWEEMRQHSMEGYEIVKANPTLTERTKRAILEHHEDKNGTGYPLALHADEVHAFSKIVCLCDVFNALTTNRSYSKARSPFEALQFIKEKLFHKIDDDCFKHLVMIYGGKLDAQNQPTAASG